MFYILNGSIIIKLQTNTYAYSIHHTSSMSIPASPRLDSDTCLPLCNFTLPRKNDTKLSTNVVNGGVVNSCGLE